MSKNAMNYFENIIIPLIQANYPNIISDMDIMILGSVGLGIDDEISDIEASIYLDDAIWENQGKQLQLLLNDCLAKTNNWKREGSILCVHPVSWLLDGSANKFLSNNDNLPWENISFETLFTMQKNTIILNSKGILTHLREKTDVTKYPEQLWKKSLITNIKELYVEEFFELNKNVQRNHIPEANILFGLMLERIYHIAFLVSHEYYPWRTHLDWTFRNLSISKTELRSQIDKLLSTSSWNERVKIIKSIIEFYKNYIKNNNLIPEIDVYSDDLETELIWAERLSAWNTPDWRNFIKEKERNAVDSGYSPEQFWVWSLWG